MTDPDIREALVEAWNDGHRAGIGCGHDLAVCRHDDIGAEIDDLASWNEVVLAALRSSGVEQASPAPEPPSEGLDAKRMTHETDAAINKAIDYLTDARQGWAVAARATLVSLRSARLREPR